MSDVRFETIEKRKSAFLEEYGKEDDVIKVARNLNIEVSTFKDDTAVRGVIAYIQNKFQIFFNTNIIDTHEELEEIIIHEISHWIFDNEQVRKRPFFDRDDIAPDNADIEFELRAINFTDNVIEMKKNRNVNTQKIQDKQ